MTRKSTVARPLKKAEYEIQFATREAQKGWRDLLATQRNAIVDAWDFLTRTPEQDVIGRCYALKGSELGTLTRDGVVHVRRQYKLAGGARIWYFVHNRVVLLENVHTAHPNQTK